MSERGWCPFAAKRPSQTFGYPQGTHGQNRPVIFVDHIMAGWKRTLDDLNWQLANGVGVTFGVGRDGSASQYASIFDAHWGNGIAGASGPNDRRGIERYDRSNRRLAALEVEGSWEFGFASRGGYWWLRAPSGGSLLNQRSISFEHEGFPFDQTGFDATWPAPMIETTIAIKRWCLEELAREGMPMTVDSDVLTGHYQIDGVNRPNCPGPEHPRTAILAGLATEEEDMGAYDKAITDALKTLADGDFVSPGDGVIYQVQKTGDIPELVRIDDSKAGLINKTIKDVPLGVAMLYFHGRQIT